MLLFVSGASSSGKSEWAEQTALKLSSADSGVPERVYLATAHVGKSDFDMQCRVARHRERRKDRGFVTIECERDLDELVCPNREKIPHGALVLLECLPNWLANEMFAPELFTGNNIDSTIIVEKIMNAVYSLREHAGHLIVVSDDIFSDGTIYNPMTENYICTLGKLHVKLANLADIAVECTSGLVRVWKGKGNI